MRLLYSFLLLSTLSYCSSVEELREKPGGYAKDLFLLEALKKAANAQDGYEAYFLTQNPKSEHATYLLKKTGSKKLSKLFDCMDTNITRALKKRPECAELGVSYKKISTAILEGSKEPKELTWLLEERAADKASKIDTLVDIASSKFVLGEKEIEAYFNSSKEFRAAFFNKRLTDEELANIAGSKNLKRVVKWSLFDPKIPLFGESLSRLECKETQDSETLFFLGLTKLKYGKEPLACFDKAAKLAKKDQDADRAKFWGYLVSGDDGRLRALSKSGDLNFYSMIAKERANLKPKNIEFADLQTKRPSQDDNASDPFFWQKFRKSVKEGDAGDILRVAKKIENLKDGEAYRLYVKERLDGYKKDMFLLPYKEAFADFNDSQKTLLHAIGKQESMFVPAIVSSAYAIGVMQIIPILAEELAQKRKEKIEFFELFEPSKNISYAATHFKWLESKLSHPTLIAVAFNAGYGFFRRVEREGLFVFEDERARAFEPFWSIENIPYDETREYAKKVSLNYAVYSQKFGEPTTLNALLENLVKLRRKD